MSLNLENADSILIRDLRVWTPLQLEACMFVATAKLEAFGDQAFRFGDLIRLGLIERREAADALQEIAIYNSLPFEYGADRVQAIIAKGLSTQ